MSQHPLATLFSRPALAWVLRGFAVMGCVAVLISVLLVGSLRWLDPTTSAFMLRHEHSHTVAGHRIPVRHQWVKLEWISAPAVHAVITAEDQNFRHHHGFDYRAIRWAIRDYRSTGIIRGSSTISQQTAKNLFLWPQGSVGRKLLETWFTVFLEALLPKQRILEIYLNIAQFGPNIYGIEAASRSYFGKPAAELTVEEGALLASILPSPSRLRVHSPNDYVIERQAWILWQLPELEKRGYLDGLYPH